MNQNTQKEAKSQRLLRLPQVLEYLPISKSSWWSGVKEGKYPASLKLGPRTTVWRESDILELVNRLNHSYQFS